LHGLFIWSLGARANRKLSRKVENGEVSVGGDRFNSAQLATRHGVDRERCVVALWKSVEGWSLEA